MVESNVDLEIAVPCPRPMVASRSVRLENAALKSDVMIDSIVGYSSRNHENVSDFVANQIRPSNGELSGFK